MKLQRDKSQKKSKENCSHTLQKSAVCFFFVVRATVNGHLRLQISSGVHFKHMRFMRQAELWTCQFLTPPQTEAGGCKPNVMDVKETSKQRANRQEGWIDRQIDG